LHFRIGEGQVQIGLTQLLHPLHLLLHFLHKALKEPLFLGGRRVIGDRVIRRKGIDCDETEHNDVKEAFHKEAISVCRHDLSPCDECAPEIRQRQKQIGRWQMGVGTGKSGNVNLCSSV
jgi:hypothetical protein